MSAAESRGDRGNDVSFGSWIYSAYRRLRLGLLTLPALERNLALELEELARLNGSLEERQLELRYLESSLQTLRVELVRTGRAVTAIAAAVDRSGIGSEGFASRLEQVPSDPELGDLVRTHLRVRGGVAAYLRAQHAALGKAHSRVSRCISMLEERAGDPAMSMRELSIRVGDCVRPEDDEPGVQYSVLLCILKPLICVVVVVVIIVLEDEIDPDPPDPDEHSEPGDYPPPPKDEIPA